MSQKTTETKIQLPESNTQVEQPLKPNPTLKQLDRLVGTWQASDPSGAGGVDGQVTFEWLEGGLFLLQHIALGKSKGIEIIGYDEESKSLKSHYFEGNTGKHLQYVYELSNDILTVSIDMAGIKGKFVGKFSDDDNTYTGSWSWIDNGVKNEYSATMTRVNK